jgi:hypothetical protein
MPGHTNKKTTIMTKVSGPEVLRVGHKGVEVLLEAPVIESIKSSGIIKVLALGVGGIGMLTENTQLQSIWPPVSVARQNQYFES